MSVDPYKFWRIQQKFAACVLVDILMAYMKHLAQKLPSETRD
jgi:hypothetical protein